MNAELEVENDADSVDDIRVENVAPELSEAGRSFEDDDVLMLSGGIALAEFLNEVPMGRYLFNRGHYH